VQLLPPVPEKPSINPTRWCGGGWMREARVRRRGCAPPCFSGLTHMLEGWLNLSPGQLQQGSGAFAVSAHVPPEARLATMTAVMVAGGWQTTGVSSSVQTGAPLLVALHWGGVIGVVIAPSFPEPCHRNSVTPQPTPRWTASYALSFSPFLKPFYVYICTISVKTCL
jgi:hypothetical protein